MWNGTGTPKMGRITVSCFLSTIISIYIPSHVTKYAPTYTDRLRISESVGNFSNDLYETFDFLVLRME